MKGVTKIEKLHEKLEKLGVELAEAYKALPGEPVEDYTLTDWNGKKVKLSKLFGKRDKLVLIHNMGKACKYCTMWADGFNSIYKYVEDRAAFAVVSPDPHEIQKAFAQKRGWKFRMLSAHGTSLFKDFGFEQEGKPWPGVSTLYRAGDGSLLRHAHTPTSARATASAVCGASSKCWGSRAAARDSHLIEARLRTFCCR